MMPGVEDWRITPLQTISKIFEDSCLIRRENSSTQDRVTWTKSVKDFLNEKLPDDVDSWRRQIPSLNVAPNHTLLDGQVVLFRGMIQDMFDPEYYPAEYEVKNLLTGKVRTATGRYQDFTNLSSREEIKEDSVVYGERHSIYCISVPGEASWVHDGYRDMSPAINQLASGSNPCRTKRSLEESNEEQMMDIDNIATKASDNKKTKNELNPTTSYPPHKDPGFLLNLPLPPSPDDRAVIVKFYDTAEEEFSLNNVYEFVGIISLDPNLACVSSEVHEELNKLPASLVPRLHVLRHFKLTHINPLLPFHLPSPDNFQAEAKSCRATLKHLLSVALLGDELAAEYLICHLISKVYQRRDILCLGKFSLNIFNIPTDFDYVKRVSRLIQILVSKSHYQQLTLNNLNQINFVPKKDYHVNRLVSGILQLSPHTHLILDETVMATGQLNSDGIKNVTALGNLISYQKVEYNFNYHTIDFHTDIPCLVISEGRSMLPSDFALMLKRPGVDNAVACVEDALKILTTEDWLSRLRRYLTLVRHMDFDLKTDIQSVVVDDFVRDRRERRSESSGHYALSTNELHEHLVLSRLISLSFGSSVMSKDVWEMTKRIEIERRARAAHLPQRSETVNR